MRTLEVHGEVDSSSYAEALKALLVRVRCDTGVEQQLAFPLPPETTPTQIADLVSRLHVHPCRVRVTMEVES